jgi:hypothetical protein
VPITSTIAVMNVGLLMRAVPTAVELITGTDRPHSLVQLFRPLHLHVQLQLDMFF